MKKIMGQKTLWITVGCLTGAIIMMVINLFLYPGIERPLENVEKCINKRDFSGIIEYIVPEQQEEAEFELNLTDAADVLGFDSTGESINIIQCDIKEEEDGTKKVYAIMLFNKNGQCKDMDSVTFEVSMIDSKPYINY